jgi:hypothetical protein
MVPESKQGAEPIANRAVIEQPYIAATCDIRAKSIILWIAGFGRGTQRDP